MKIEQNSDQNLVLSKTPWGMALMGVVAAAFCIWFAATQMADKALHQQAVVYFVGLVFASVFTLPMRKIRIHFNRAAGVITRTTYPLLPLDALHWFRPRSEVRPIDTILYAYLERQKSQTSSSASQHRSHYSLALANANISDEVLAAEHAFLEGLELDQLRWLVGHNAAMLEPTAGKVLAITNQWLGKQTPRGSRMG